MTFREKFKAACIARSQALARRLTNNEILDEAAAIHEYSVLELQKEWEKKPKRAKKVAEMSDAEWVAYLEGEPALSGINVKQEIGRAQFWCRNNKRVPTRRFLVNWLNKAEKVVDLKAMGATHATNLKIPAPDGPDGWLVWLNTELSLISEEHPAHGQLLFALNSRKFSGLPESWRTRCNQQLRA
jgi:hypothetical protein